jgi:N-acetylmuramoyl-L-alanine amidase
LGIEGKNVTRAEFISMVIKALKIPVVDAEIKFSDVSREHWAFAYINTAVQKGIVNGFPDGSFKPNNPTTRAEIAKVISKAFNLAEPLNVNLFADAKVS